MASKDQAAAPLSVDAADRHVYMVGGGIGSLAAAAFMVRDGNIPGGNITIYEALPVLGGSLDAGGDAVHGYRLRGGRMLTTDNYECTWGLFKTIPSLTTPGQSVYDETIAFNRLHLPHSRARLVDRRRAKPDVETMGFSMQDRLELLKLAIASEEALGVSRITDWLSPPFFETNFWFMWSTTFAFQPWHSAVEFNRYLHRFMLEFTRIETLAGVKRTIFNQYDSLVRPLQQWLQAKGVQFVTDCTVTDIQLAPGAGITVTSITHRKNGGHRTIDVAGHDLVVFQNASMTDASSFGSMTTPPPRRTGHDSQGWALWERLANGRPEFGNPSTFNSSIPESAWESFTVTMRDTVFLDRMEAFSGNAAGTGGLVTFRDSAWLLSIVIPHQPHCVDQPADVQVFWGYALHPDRVGDCVPKPMSDCTGEDILRELCGHLNFGLDTVVTAICIPCRMPYITSMFMPRAKADRPSPVPAGSTNLALISQFVEIPEDVVFTVEYSVRAAQIAVYQLLGIDAAIPPILHHDKSAKVQLEAVIKAFR